MDAALIINQMPTLPAASAPPATADTLTSQAAPPQDGPFARIFARLAEAGITQPLPATVDEPRGGQAPPSSPALPPLQPPLAGKDADVRELLKLVEQLKQTIPRENSLTARPDATEPAAQLSLASVQPPLLQIVAELEALVQELDIRPPARPGEQQPVTASPEKQTEAAAEAGPLPGAPHRPDTLRADPVRKGTPLTVLKAAASAITPETSVYVEDGVQPPTAQETTPPAESNRARPLAELVERLRHLVRQEISRENSTDQSDLSTTAAPMPLLLQLASRLEALVTHAGGGDAAPLTPDIPGVAAAGAAGQSAGLRPLPRQVPEEELVRDNFAERQHPEQGESTFRFGERRSLSAPELKVSSTEHAELPISTLSTTSPSSGQVGDARSPETPKPVAVREAPVPSAAAAVAATASALPTEATPSPAIRLAATLPLTMEPPAPPAPPQAVQAQSITQATQATQVAQATQATQATQVLQGEAAQPAPDTADRSVAQSRPAPAEIRPHDNRHLTAAADNRGEPVQAPAVSRSGPPSTEAWQQTVNSAETASTGKESLPSAASDRGGAAPGHGELPATGFSSHLQPPGQSPVTSLDQLSEPIDRQSHESIISQVREKLDQHQIRPGDGQVTLKLNPDSLGELKINLRMEDQRLRVEIVAEHRTVKEALLQNLDSLRESLTRQNITVERFNVSTGGGQGFGQQQFNEGRQAAPVRPVVPFSRPAIAAAVESRMVDSWGGGESSLVSVRL